LSLNDFKHKLITKQGSLLLVAKCHLYILHEDLGLNLSEADTGLGLALAKQVDVSL
jgi:hypothetical protein